MLVNVGEVSVPPALLQQYHCMTLDITTFKYVINCAWFVLYIVNDLNVILLGMVLSKQWFNEKR